MVNRAPVVTLGTRGGALSAFHVSTLGALYSGGRGSVLVDRGHAATRLWKSRCARLEAVLSGEPATALLRARARIQRQERLAHGDLEDYAPGVSRESALSALVTTDL